MTGGTLKSSSSVRVVTANGVTGAKAARTTTSQQVTTFGVTTAKANVLVSRARTLAPGASDVIDLYAGLTLLDPDNQSAPFGRVRFIEIAITSGGDAAGLVIGGAPSAEWVGFFRNAGDQFVIFPTGPSFRGGSSAGVAVTSAAKNLKIHNVGAAGLTYDIVVAGVSPADSGYAMGVLGLTYA